ncbi:carbonic anhydrase 4-like [Hoplias malabaricus]|uniref:carbonic anhydrase 4-like n=1 Tax=Hoplias malabaricus TaxID=27720 RepID=UPI0034618A67
MKVQLVTLIAACLLPTALSEGSSAVWCYNLPSCNSTTWPIDIPEHCSGTKQSPVNIVTANIQGDASLVAFNFAGFDDSSAVLQIQNADGKSVKVSLDDSKVNVSGGGLPGVYVSEQFHIHWGNGSSSAGSEHTVDGKQYAMELHIVNIKSIYPNVTAALADPTGLAVLGFFIEATSDSGKPQSWKNLTSYLSSIPNNGNTLDIMNTITLNSLLQGVDKTKYYRYNGSLTTPSCNEGVVWTVFKDTIKVSQDLINLFSTTLYINTKSGPLITNNFRPVQKLNNRVIKSQVSSASTLYPALSISTALLIYTLSWL